MNEQTYKANEVDYARSLRKHGWIGLILVVLFLGGLTIWAAITTVAGAVPAAGHVKVEGNPKSVQHAVGGTVAEIRVKNGDIVQSGQVLAILSDRDLSSKIKALSRKHDDALIKQARTAAELADGIDVQLPPGLAAPDDPAAKESLRTQQEILRTNQTTLASSISQLEAQVAQIGHQITSVESQRESINRQLDLAIAAQESVAKQPAATASPTPASSGAPPGSQQAEQLNALKRGAEIASLKGQAAAITANVAQLQGSITEKRLQITQTSIQNKSRALQELEVAQDAASAMNEDIIATNRSIEQMKILSPAAGMVHESLMDTVGGVVGAGDTLMKIVPQTTDLEVELRVSTTDIDKVRPSGQVMLRLSSFDPRSTPEVKAAIGTVAPDATTDPSTGARFYVVEAKVEAQALAALPPDLRLQPGMPVDTFIQTEEHTVLSYLLKPVSDQLNRAFRED